MASNVRMGVLLESREEEEEEEEEDIDGDEEEILRIMA